MWIVVKNSFELQNCVTYPTSLYLISPCNEFHVLINPQTYKLPVFGILTLRSFRFVKAVVICRSKDAFKRKTDWCH